MREAMLITHFIGLAMGLGTSFANLFLGLASAKLPPEEAGKFRIHAMALTRMGHIGITLLILSGFYLITPYWSLLSEMPLLIVKLVLVAFLVILISIVTRFAVQVKKGNMSNAGKIHALGKLILVTALTVVIIAVSVFH
jgi:hypothetical protein